IDNILLDDVNGNVRKMQYTYNNPKSTPDNGSVFYGEVIAENKGFGTGNNGKIKTIFNNGNSDIQLAGLPLEVYVVDATNVTKQKTTNTWNKNLKYISSTSGWVGLGYFLTISSKKEELFLNGQTITSITNNIYNSNGQISKTSSTNSRGQIESQEIIYANEQYPFVYDKNMISYPYQTKTKLDGDLVNVERVLWTDVNGKAYINQNLSGSNESNLRLNSDITFVDSNGN